jgi:hypothetical protein
MRCSSSREKTLPTGLSALRVSSDVQNERLRWGRHTRRVDNQHLSARGDGALELVKINGPLGGREGLDGALFGRMHRHIDDLAAGHFDVADILVKEGLKDDNLVAGLNESHEGAQHA